MNTYSKRIEIYAERQAFNLNEVAIWLFRKTTTPEAVCVEMATPLEFKGNMPQDGSRIDPTMSLIPAAAQQLMDELWRCGIRPVEAAGSAGQMAATEKHLEDMRKLAFHALQIK